MVQMVQFHSEKHQNGSNGSNGPISFRTTSEWSISFRTTSQWFNFIQNNIWCQYQLFQSRTHSISFRTTYFSHRTTYGLNTNYFSHITLQFHSEQHPVSIPTISVTKTPRCFLFVKIYHFGVFMLFWTSYDLFWNIQYPEQFMFPS
jgi:hypothetical protein